MQTITNNKHKHTKTNQTLQDNGASSSFNPTLHKVSMLHNLIYHQHRLTCDICLCKLDYSIIIYVILPQCLLPLYTHIRLQKEFVFSTKPAKDAQQHSETQAPWPSHSQQFVPLDTWLHCACCPLWIDIYKLDLFRGRYSHSVVQFPQTFWCRSPTTNCAYVCMYSRIPRGKGLFSFPILQIWKGMTFHMTVYIH